MLPMTKVWYFALRNCNMTHELAHTFLFNGEKLLILHIYCSGLGNFRKIFHSRYWITHCALVRLVIVGAVNENFEDCLGHFLFEPSFLY
jgi:hypothetical protein